MTTRCGAPDAAYQERVRAVLIADPCRGVPTDAAMLLPHIYIGSQSNAESLRLLRHLGIDHVLNVAGYKGPRPSAHASPYEGLGIDYHEFQAEDYDSYDITQHFGDAFAYLDKVKASGGRALVHCAMGVNRSAAVCAAYIMHDRGLTLLKTIQLIKNERRVCLTNKGFQMQLVRYARRKGLLDHIEVEAHSRFSGKSVDERIESSLRRDHGYVDDRIESSLRRDHGYVDDRIESSLRRDHGYVDDRIESSLRPEHRYLDDRIESALRRDHGYVDAAGRGRSGRWGDELGLGSPSSYPSRSHSARDLGSSRGEDVLSRRIREVLDSKDHRDFELPSSLSRSLRSVPGYDSGLLEPRREARDRYISREDRY